MGIQVYWDENESDIIHWVFPPYWTWDELLEQSAISHGLIGESDSFVCIIVDHSHSTWIPGGYNSKFAETLAFVHPRVVLVLIISSSNLLKALVYGFGLFVRPLPFKYRFVDSVDEARNMVIEFRKICPAPPDRTDQP